MTLVDWLNTERIRLSCELLETTNLSIEKIAELSGFRFQVSIIPFHLEKIFVKNMVLALRYEEKPLGSLMRIPLFNIMGVMRN